MKVAFFFNFPLLFGFLSECLTLIKYSPPHWYLFPEDFISCYLLKNQSAGSHRSTVLGCQEEACFPYCRPNHRIQHWNRRRGHTQARPHQWKWITSPSLLSPVNATPGQFPSTSGFATWLEEEASSIKLPDLGQDFFLGWGEERREAANQGEGYCSCLWLKNTWGTQSSLGKVLLHRHHWNKQEGFLPDCVLCKINVKLVLCTQHGSLQLEKWI